MLKCFQIAEIRVHLIVSYLSYSVVFFRRNSFTFQPVYWFWKIFWLQMIYLSWKLSAEGNFTCKIFYQPTKTLYLTFSSLFSFFEDRFCCGMVKRKNFLHVVDLLFVTRFLKYLFKLHYHEQCPINNIQVKCFQIGQMYVIFLNMFSQIERIADFIILVKWLWFLIATTNFTNEWKLFNLYREVLTVQRSCELYRHAIWRILKLCNSGSNFYLNIVFLLLLITFIPSLRIFFLSSMF